MNSKKRPSNKKRKKTYKKRNKKIRIILYNLIIIVLFIIIVLLLLNTIVPATRTSLSLYSPSSIYDIDVSDRKMESFVKTTVSEINTYGETINITSENLGSSYNINLFDTTNEKVNYSFKMDEAANAGIETQDMPVGSFFLQLDDESFISYDDDFTLDFYTITRDGKNNNITVDVVNGLVHITKYEAEDNDDELDIMIDPGHGGTDGGSSSDDGTILEKDLNLQASILLADKLTDMGYNVGLTREDDSQPGETKDGINAYQEGGRVTQVYDTEAKLVISMHHNKGGASGFEVYSSYYANNDFATLLASYLSNVSTPSSKITGYISDGVYVETYDDTTDDGASIVQDYMYMIRESGGIATKSVNEENVQNNLKPQGAEGVLIELGYLDDATDLAHVSDTTVMEQETEQIALAIDDYINNTPSALIDLTEQTTEEEE
ncbi:N-acetylmuramoyl-L-alanine amidase [Mollicutes bacterium LVI A0078]|nr:N-acetylmuramoyl-L-alanine amidase [Mollicutes bacterium LVI A0075]WOO91694.1 N-acetylmuramoyl-L-alanine amidase [Mollicutes bacterium LVI A0078]